MENQYLFRQRAVLPASSGVFRRLYMVEYHRRADGSVSTYPGLTYYAPLELAIPRALRELGPEALGLKPGDRLDLDVLDFCVDRRTPDGVPVARVTLSADGRAPVTVAKPLPAGATPLQTRALLASALLEAIRDARK